MRYGCKMAIEIEAFSTEIYENVQNCQKLLNVIESYLYKKLKTTSYAIAT